MSTREQLLNKLDTLTLRYLISVFEGRGEAPTEPIAANVLAVVVKFLKDNSMEGPGGDTEGAGRLAQLLAEEQRRLDDGTYYT
jgi:hypothetical protein